MSMQEPSSPSVPFGLTPRQRRLRVMTLVLLAVIVVMIAIGMTHPFFHIVKPPEMTQAVRRVLAVRGMMILAYWTACLLLTLSLFLVAWLDLREIRLKLLMARRDMWKEIAKRSKERRENSDRA